MPLPPRPRKRFEGRFAAPVRTSTPERLRRMTEREEAEEKPFDPERRGSWRGGARELVLNPSQFDKDLKELILERWGPKLHAGPEQALKKARAILKEGGRPNDVLLELDELLETHGVEYIPGIKEEISYLNAGDTYEPTIMYSRDENKYFISDWGTIVENASNEAEDDAWGEWLESEVKSDLEGELEARLEDNEKLRERALGWLEDVDSDDLKAKFWRALQDAGGEYVHESDGSVFVSGKDKAVQELAGIILAELTAVPEQTSFGFNPRRRNGGSMTAEEFMAALKAAAHVGDRTLRMDFAPRTGQLFVNYYNLPEEIVGRREGGGAEAENNRQSFTVTGFSVGRTGAGMGTPISASTVKIEQRVNTLDDSYRLRGKTGAPDKVAAYLGAFLTKVAAEVPPRYTHTRAPNARARGKASPIGPLPLPDGLHADRLSTGTQKSTGWPTETWVVREEDMTPVQQVELYKQGDGAWHAWTGNIIREKQKMLAREVAAERNHA